MSGWPPFTRSELSSAKDENVVKPPQIPAFKKRTNLGFADPFFAVSPAITPIRKAPAALMAKVLTGKAVSSLTGIRPIR